MSTGHELHPQLLEFLSQLSGAQRSAGTVLDVEDPATGVVFAQVRVDDAGDVAEAVDRAHVAFRQSQADYDPAGRGRVLYRLADRLEGLCQPMAQLLTLEVGKPLHESVGEVASAVATLRYYAGMADKLGGDTVPAPAGTQILTVREPKGVCGAIVPWNFPISVVAWKVGPCLAAGNALVLKPAEQTPVSALWLQQLAQESGLAEGIFTVVNGPGSVTGAALATDPRIAKLSFTGSQEVGHRIAQEVASLGTEVTLELGGKSPHIVFDDADLSLAVPDVAAAIFANQGQVCCAGSRLFVAASRFDEVVEGVAAIADGLRLGHGLDPATQMGPLVSAGQLARVRRMVDDAGAEVRHWTGQRDLPGAGHFYAPTVVETSRQSSLATQEVFGPVLAAHAFVDEDELVGHLNDADFDLAAGLWTASHDRAVQVSRQLRVGTVWVNGWGRLGASTPFGGRGKSGFGRDLGVEAMASYTDVKTVVSTLRATGPLG